MKHVFVPIVTGLLFFVAAISFNEAIVSTINFYTADRDVLIPTNTELFYKWVYFLVSISALCLFTLVWKHTLSSFRSHRDPQDLPADSIPDSIPEPAIPIL